MTSDWQTCPEASGPLDPADLDQADPDAATSSAWRIGHADPGLAAIGRTLAAERAADQAAREDRARLDGALNLS
jgi:hypothetical protein